MQLDNQDLLLVLDVEKWQLLQDSMAVMTSMAIITVDNKGVPITRHSSCNEFCNRMRAVPSLNMECQKCDSRGGLEAARLRKPYIYRCHANILDAAIPIIVNNNYLGAIMIGQVLLTNEDDLHQLEILCASSRQKLEQHLGSDISLMDLLPRLSLDRVKIIVDMLHHLCNYIVEEASEKNLALDICAEVLDPKRFQDSLSAYRLKTLEGIKRRIDSAILDTHTNCKPAQETKVVNTILQPAIRYINEHKHESCHLSQMAALCHISPSYFSKLFSREMGETYSSYLMRSRIKWAKELLKTTDQSISEIAMAVGFSDSGHFIRSFKKHEGITPARFRKFLV